MPAIRDAGAAQVRAKTPEKTRVKICGLTREADVDAAVAAGADAVGFVLYAKSARAVSAARAAELARRLPPFVTPVLLFVNEASAQVRAACAMVPGCWAQFHGDESPRQCLHATQFADGGARPFLRAAHMPLGAAQPRFDLVEYALRFSHAAAILLDAQVPGYGGGGKTFPWSLLPTNVPAHLVLSGGLTPANVADGMAQVRPRGLSLAVDVSSGVEAEGPHGQPRKGIKDADKIHRFIAAVRAADARAHTASAGSTPVSCS